MLKEELQEKYLSIYQYLHDFAKIRTRSIKNLDNYEKTLFFQDCVNGKNCHVTILNNDDASESLWIKVKKPTEPVLKLPSSDLKLWIDQDSLHNILNKPILLETIDSNNETLYIKNFPNIQREFDDYYNNIWLEWADLYKNYEYEISIYKKLYDIYNKSKKFSEEYEVVIGIGLLVFLTDKSAIIKRHILVSNTNIEFYPEKGVFEITPGADGCKFRAETDMVSDLEGIHNFEATEALKKFIVDKNLSDSPFSSENKEILKGYINILHPEGQFIDSLEKPGQSITEKPLLHYCPTLILRKRNLNTLTFLFEKIIENIKQNQTHVPILDDLVGNNHTEKSNVLIQENLKNDSNEAIYFPKEWNEDQIQIVERIKNNDKVLVQGPPGTGKSHTIANLICHLLATGNKILITAYTKRALTVLKNQLPDEIKPLCVNLLGNDKEAINDLELSVREITNRLSYYSVHKVVDK